MSTRQQQMTSKPIDKWTSDLLAAVEQGWYPVAPTIGQENAVQFGGKTLIAKSAHRLSDELRFVFEESTDTATSNWLPIFEQDSLGLVARWAQWTARSENAYVVDSSITRTSRSTRSETVSAYNWAIEHENRRPRALICRLNPFDSIVGNLRIRWKSATGRSRETTGNIALSTSETHYFLVRRDDAWILVATPTTQNAELQHPTPPHADLVALQVILGNRLFPREVVAVDSELAVARVFPDIQTSELPPTNRRLASLEVVDLGALSRKIGANSLILLAANYWLLSIQKNIDVAFLNIKTCLEILASLEATEAHFNAANEPLWNEWVVSETPKLISMANPGDGEGLVSRVRRAWMPDQAERLKITLSRLETDILEPNIETSVSEILDDLSLFARTGTLRRSEPRNLQRDYKVVERLRTFARALILDVSSSAANPPTTTLWEANATSRQLLPESFWPDLPAQHERPPYIDRLESFLSALESRSHGVITGRLRSLPVQTNEHRAYEAVAVLKSKPNIQMRILLLREDRSGSVTIDSGEGSVSLSDSSLGLDRFLTSIASSQSIHSRLRNLMLLDEPPGAR